jgi:hypothetical protein
MLKSKNKEIASEVEFLKRKKTDVFSQALQTIYKEIFKCE